MLRNPDADIRALIRAGKYGILSQTPISRLSANRITVVTRCAPSANLSRHIVLMDLTMPGNGMER